MICPIEVESLFPSNPSPDMRSSFSSVTLNQTSTLPERSRRRVLKARRILGTNTSKHPVDANLAKDIPSIHNEQRGSTTSDLQRSRRDENQQNDRAAAQTPFVGRLTRNVLTREMKNRKSNGPVNDSMASFLENESLCGVEHNRENGPPLTDNIMELQGTGSSVVQFGKKRKSFETALNIIRCTSHTAVVEAVEVPDTTTEDKASEKISHRVKRQKESGVSFNASAIASGSGYQRRMPNFPNIFKAQLKNAENIQEYAERKKRRAALLLSGAKPIIGAMKCTTHTKKIKKELTFTTEGSPNVAFLPRIAAAQVKFAESTPSTPRSNYIRKRIGTPGTPLIKPNSGRTKNPTPKNTCSSTIGLLDPNRNVTKRPLKLQNQPVIVPSSSSDIPKSQPVVKSRIPVLGGVTNKTGWIATEERARLEPQAAALRPHKADLVKAVLQKVRDPQTGAAKRDFIKGVRSNRRFDLLMAMREKKN